MYRTVSLRVRASSLLKSTFASTKWTARGGISNAPFLLLASSVTIRSWGWRHGVVQPVIRRSKNGGGSGSGEEGRRTTGKRIHRVVFFTLVFTSPLGTLGGGRSAPRTASIRLARCGQGAATGGEAWSRSRTTSLLLMYQGWRARVVPKETLQ
ncbi:hypothetical protein B0H66DRAFT_541298 [Apodospora peruviana]|uniref:Uncharacterized protein n=1 Tax=Apodospora peruviana TaxID=516989 RepID=A0AAE0MFV9_9PEZI|nr:hypothetical protein B0H66DRAFT_541298 [Apodospora peruviana]